MHQQLLIHHLQARLSAQDLELNTLRQRVYVARRDSSVQTDTTTGTKTAQTQAGIELTEVRSVATNTNIGESKSVDTQTAADSTNSKTIIRLLKRKTLDEIKCHKAVKARKQEQTQAFQDTAELFSQGPGNNGIKDVSIKISYIGGEEDEFPAWPLTETNPDAQPLAEQEYVQEKVLPILYIKNRYSVSYKVLHEMRMLGMPIPPKQELLEHNKRLARSVDIVVDVSINFLVQS